MNLERCANTAGSASSSRTGIAGWLEAVASEFSGCAAVCAELRALDYELPPEIEGAIPKGLPDDLIMTHGARVFFRNQCTRAEELMRTLLLVLKATP